MSENKLETVEIKVPLSQEVVILFEKLVKQKKIPYKNINEFLSKKVAYVIDETLKDYSREDTKTVNFHIQIGFLRVYDDAIKGAFPSRQEAILDGMRNTIQELEEQKRQRNVANEKLNRGVEEAS